MSKTPRNAPCPCGSGAKYKKCCLTKDREADKHALERDKKLATGRKIAEADEMARLFGEDFSPDMIDSMQSFAASSIASSAASIERLEAFREEWSSLYEQLELHRDAFLKEIGKPDFLEDGFDFFGDERFSSFHPTSDEIQTILDDIGFFDEKKASDDYFQAKFEEGLVEFSKSFQSKEGVTVLMEQAASLVEEEQYHEAWMIVRSCEMIVEDPDEVALITDYFWRHGIRKWQGQSSTTETAFLEGLGLNIEDFSNLSEEESATLLASVLEDPEKMAQLEAFLEANPELVENAMEHGESMDELFFDVFVGEHALTMFSVQEMAPWLNRMMEMIEKRDIPPPTMEVDEDGEEVLVESDQMLEMFSEVSTAICEDMTQKRIKQIRKDLTQLLQSYEDDDSEEAEETREVLSYGIAELPDAFDNSAEESILSVLVYSCVRSHFYEFVSQAQEMLEE